MRLGETSLSILEKTFEDTCNCSAGDQKCKLLCVLLSESGHALVTVKVPQLSSFVSLCEHYPMILYLILAFLFYNMRFNVWMLLTGNLQLNSKNLM